MGSAGGTEGKAAGDHVTEDPDPRDWETFGNVHFQIPKKRMVEKGMRHGHPPWGRGVWSLSLPGKCTHPTTKNKIWEMKRKKKKKPKHKRTKII